MKPLLRAGVASLCLAAGVPAAAADFHLFLKCDGQATADGKSTPAQVSLALRDNNNTALVQQSDVLPVGERLNYVESPMAYSMTYKLPGTRTPLFYDWWNGRMFVWLPALKQLNTVRLSIDRMSGSLSGQMLNADGTSLAALAMACRPVTPDELTQRKF